MAIRNDHINLIWSLQLFFYLRYLKHKIYVNNFQTIQELGNSFRQEITVNTFPCYEKFSANTR